MAEVAVENVSRNLWPSKLKLLEAEYENTKLLVHQETLKCQKWKQEIDLLMKEEKLHRKSLNVGKLRRTVKQKDNVIEVSNKSTKLFQLKINCSTLGENIVYAVKFGALGVKVKTTDLSYKLFLEATIME